MFELIPGFANFLIWEAQSKDTIDFKKVYVDMSGDLLSGLLLSQLVFWYLPSRDGGNKLQVQKEGEYWIAKSRQEWWDEIRMAPREVDKALAQLRAAGIIETRVFKFAGNPTTHIRILPAGFMETLNAVTKDGRERPQQKFQREGRRGKKTVQEEADPLLQMCDNQNGGGYYESEITNSQKYNNLDITNVGDGTHTLGTSSTETPSENTKENSQSVSEVSASLFEEEEPAEVGSQAIRDAKAWLKAKKGGGE